MKNKTRTPQSEYKIAIVTDPLIKYESWYEDFKYIIKIFPNSELFTPYYNPEIIRQNFPEIKLHDSFLQLISPEDNRKEKWLRREILAYKTFRFKDFDIILSVSSRGARFIKSRKKKHIAIIRRPRKLFENPKMQEKDINALENIESIITNSISDKRRVRRVYSLNADVIYPPIETSKFKPDKLLHRKENWFLTDSNISSRALKLVIKSTVKANAPLKIVGALRDDLDVEQLTKELKARGLVKFVGELSEDARIQLMQRCRAYIYPIKSSSFGRIAVEANAAGTPVVAYRRGAVIETISSEHPKTGIFFKKYNSDSLSKVLKDFNDEEFDSKNCIMKAQEFDSTIFMYKLKNYVEDILQSN